MEDLVEVSKWLVEAGVGLDFILTPDPPPLALHTLLVFHSWLFDCHDDGTFEDYDLTLAEENGWPTLAERRASA